MAAIRYFLGMSQAELETALAEARADLLAGTTLQTAGAADATAGFAIAIPPQRRVELILEELSILDPVKYPPANCVPIRRTTAIFRDL